MEKKRIDLKTAASLLVLCILVPLALYVYKRIGNRDYLGVSLCVLFLCALPFLAIYTKRKIRAREVIMLLVMSAIAVAFRAAFIMVDNFKPMCAIIMICGAGLGPQAGLLCGAVSCFASNFIFGQGPWTPWQMLAYAAAGFVFGLLFSGKKRGEPLVMASAGAVITFLLVGFILDTSAIFTMGNMIDVSRIWPVYRSGIPVNLIHAAASFLTVFFLARPMLERLDRIKLKYGMMEEDEI